MRVPQWHKQILLPCCRESLKPQLSMARRPREQNCPCSLGVSYGKYYSLSIRVKLANRGYL